jgi:hypothetical protein
MAAKIHSRLLAALPGFRVVGVAHCGADPRLRLARSATGRSTNSPPAVRVAAPSLAANAASTSRA